MAWLDNLVAHWKLNETSGTRYDEHSTNDLTDNNTVLYSTGKLGNAASFNADNSEYLSVADNAELSLSTDTPFTLAAWVQIYALNSRPIIAKTTGLGTNTEYWLGYTGSLDRFYLTVGNGSSYAQAIANNLGSPSSYTWYFIVAWHDPTTDKLYIQINNGTPDEAAWSGGTQDLSTSVCVGYDPNYIATHWHGLIDSLSFWKRVLTSDERTALYNSGAGLDYPFSVPTSLPPFRDQLQHLIIR